jgi:hypothetical protein
VGAAARASLQWCHRWGVCRATWPAPQLLKTMGMEIVVGNGIGAIARSADASRQRSVGQDEGKGMVARDGYK